MSFFKKYLNLIEKNVNEDKIYLSLTILTGLICGLVAVFIHYSVEYLTHLLSTYEVFSLKTFIYGGICVLVSGYITTRIEPDTSGSGIPFVRVSLAAHKGTLKFKFWTLKIVTSILSLSSGMSLGREGPTVAITSGIGSSLGRVFHLPKRRIKALVAVGSAGGLAAAFNTPIAAVIFTLEEIVGDLNAKVLGSIVISAAIASIVASSFRGDQLALTEVHYTLTNHRDLLIYMLIGLAAAFLGPLWSKFVLSVRKENIKLFKGHKLTVMFLAFVFMALISTVNPGVLGSGHELINKALLSEIKGYHIFGALFILKFICTGICYGSGISGGLFMPTLFIGAMLGGFVGTLCMEIPFFSDNNIGAFALVGMGAFFVAVIRSPFTSIIMVFEMTRDHEIILPLMVANIISYVVSGHFHSGSIYENISEQDGIYLPSKDEDLEVLDTIIVEDAMNCDFEYFSPLITVKSALSRVKKSDIGYYPVYEGNEIIGVVSKHQIVKCYANYKGHGKKTYIKSICSNDYITIYPDQSLLLSFHKLKKFNVEKIYVVSRLNKKFLHGVITAEDIVKNFGYHLEEKK